MHAHLQYGVRGSQGYRKHRIGRVGHLRMNSATPAEIGFQHMLIICFVCQAPNVLQILSSAQVGSSIHLLDSILNT